MTVNKKDHKKRKSPYGGSANRNIVIYLKGDNISGWTEGNIYETL